MTVANAVKLLLNIFFVFVVSISHAQINKIGDVLGKAKNALGKVRPDSWVPGGAITTSINDTLYGFTWLENELNYLSDETDTIQSFDLAPGHYKASIRSYCLHAGVYGPSKGDGYQIAKLKGAKSNLVRNLLDRSAEHPEISQEDVQTLIWGIEAGAKFSSYSPSFQVAVKPLLTPAEIAGMEVNVADLAKRAVPAELKEIAQTYESLRYKMQASQVKYDEIEAIAVKTGAPPLGIGSKVINTDVWSYIGNGFFLKASPYGYKRTDIEIYRPSSPELKYDSKERISKYMYNGYSVEIVYDDQPGRDQIIVDNHTIPVWIIKSYNLKGPGAGQSLQVPANQWVYRGKMADFSTLVNSPGMAVNIPQGGPSVSYASGSEGNPTWQEIKARYKRTKEWVDRYNEYRDYVKEYEDMKNPPEMDKYIDETAVNENIYEGLKAALNPIDKKGQSNWIRKNLAMTLDMMFYAICQLKGECGDNSPRRPELSSHPAQPGNTSKQRIGLSPYKSGL
ncbi:hypothetical protein DXN04_06415 [Chitinophaga silvisoli]|uniref:Uncharacterized protein n=1 Tax=Chitinophaga silvisoli TaxID=2291814 RepID=A0A3E1P4I9_9BACT|nr:hypothetical protein DXN04_06415 [Chitinophaga silvisoli]